LEGLLEGRRIRDLLVRVIPDHVCSECYIGGQHKPRLE
jgi:hypothetical protein